MVKEVKFQSTLVFFVNGIKVEDDNIDPEWTLLYYLRNKLKLTGAKLGCGEGGCGACTVMISKYDHQNSKVIHIPVNACLAPICSMHGLAVTTVEGIGSTRTKLHPIQERIAKSHGSQCGFCTPGIVMSMYTLLRNSPIPSMEEIELAFQGNLCRCTGYRAIIDGFKTFTEEKWELKQIYSKINEKNNNVCSLGDKCCKLQKNKKIEENVVKSDYIPYDSTQEPIFPPELKLSDKYDKDFLYVKGSNVTWFRPTTLEQLLDLKYQYPDAKIVVGNTEIGVEVKFKNVLYPIIIQPTIIKELTEITSSEKGVWVGASATLMDLEMYLRNEIQKVSEEKTRIFKQIVEMLNWFAGKQIRSVGAVGGNIMTGSPISDLIPILMANRVQLQLINKYGKRFVNLDDKFYIGYRKTLLQPHEILSTIYIPYTDDNRYCFAYKQSRRREDDIAIVNCALNVSFIPETNVIANLYLAFGGMSFKTVTAPKTEEKLKGLVWNRNTLELAYLYLLEDLPLNAEAPGGMVSYRKSLSLSLFFRGFMAIFQQLQKKFPNIKIDKRELSGIKGFRHKEYKSSQYYRVKTELDDKYGAVHRPLVHINAFKQATGEAIYCDDLPPFENELHMAFVLSTKSHAKIKLIDPSPAFKMDESVVDFVCAKDLEEKHNFMGTIVKDEKVFYNDIVTSQGQIIGAILATDQKKAQKAAKQVKIEYEELEPIIITIEDAIKYNSFFDDVKPVLKKGNVDEIFKKAPHIIEGECRMGGQEHFYFETQCCIVVPRKEDNEIDVYASTQNPTELTREIAAVLNLQQNKVITHVKRIGGGFGGKESKALMVAIPVAVAAKKVNRPVRCMLDRDEDIIMTGGRHPFLAKYKIAFDNNGKIMGCDLNIYCNGGYAHDLSKGVIERAITHIDNAYFIPCIRAKGYICKTNIPSNTAFRGFGGPQGMFIGECIIDDIANHLKINSVKISEINLYKEGDLTPYNQLIINCNIKKCWIEMIKSSNYAERKKRIDSFNKENKYKKKGLSLIPTKYGVSFNATFLNQGSALVLVYTDGSVLLSHGGIEMGQGLYTKMLQVTSTALGISIEKIHTTETSTDKVVNTSPTAASCGSDLNGMAIIDACNQINQRLKKYKEKNPKGQWEDWVKSAYYDRVCLAATGFYKTPDIGYDWITGKGTMYNYFTCGAACCEVEIDTLTGDHQVHNIDIVMDLGNSLNPAIDVGQIEGAFMQGYGLFVLEEMIYGSNGTIFSRGPGTYKLPGFGDIPGEFNVKILESTSNPRAVYSSKAVGEPPLFLGSSVYFAIKDAIKAARFENKITSPFKLLSPATAERIRMACKDPITSKIIESPQGTFRPWNVIV